MDPSSYEKVGGEGNKDRELQYVQGKGDPTQESRRLGAEEPEERAIGVDPEDEDGSRNHATEGFQRRISEGDP